MVFNEFKIKHLNIKNRLVIPPMAIKRPDDLGFVTDSLIEYYDSMTKDQNMGLVIVEHSYVNIKGKAHLNQLGMDNLNKVDGLKKLVNTIKANGCGVIAQISHAGQATSKEVTGFDTIGVSNIAYGRRNAPDSLFTEEEIEDLINDFVNAALIAKKAGFDGCEIHSAHGYLLNQFYSKFTNKRSDKFGGPIENRIYVHLEIIRRIRKSVGKDFLIFIRLGAIDYNMDGNTLEDAISAINILKNEEIDCFDISGGLCGYNVQELANTPGFFKEVTKEIKKITDIPVILTGGVKTLKDADNLLKENAADLIGVGRKVLFNNHWLKDELFKESLSHLNDIGTVQLETERLILRKAVIDDYIDVYNNWTSIEEVSKYVTWDTHKKEEDTKKYLEYVVMNYHRVFNFDWMVVLKENNLPIGQITVVHIYDDGTAELGYCFSPNYWNKGYCTECVKAVIKFLFNEVNVTRIIAKHLNDNPASGKVMIKAGMKLINTQIINHRGVEKEASVYEIKK